MEMDRLIGMCNSLKEALDSIKEGVESSDLPDLPQIIVVGGQSSGKSSVLENIVGKSCLPRGSGIVTRRPLVMMMQTSEHEYATFKHAGEQRFYSDEEIRSEIEADTQRICQGDKGLSSEEIFLRIYSPNVPNLTLVDLPGITKVAVAGQPEDIGEQIERMVYKYAKRENTILLAVTAANQDLANSDAILCSRKCDPGGVRTLGVLIA
jgi:hypothetical protein